MKMSTRFAVVAGWCALMYTTAAFGQEFIPIKYKFTSIDVHGHALLPHQCPECSSWLVYRARRK
jgi:hypothetical protein